MKQAFDIFGSWWYEQLGGLFVAICWVIVAFLVEFAYMMFLKSRNREPLTDLIELIGVTFVLGLLIWLLPPVLIILVGMQIIGFWFKS